MRNLQYTTLLILCFISAQISYGQRRFQISERWEYRLSQVAGFSMDDVDNHTDLFWGLHASQYVGSHHLFGCSMEGAWSSYMNDMPGVSIKPGGGAAGFHFLYEYQYSGILFQTGLGVNYQHVYNNLRDTSIYHYDMRDKWETVESASYTLKHDFMHRQDLSRNIYAQVPLYVGHYILGPHGVGYWLVGVQFNYALWGKTRQTVEGSTMAQYEPYLGIWREMDNHGYRKDVPIVREGEGLKLKMDILGHAEMGYEITTYNGPHNYRIVPGDRVDCRFRVAGFVDCGLFNICPQTSNVLYGIPTETIYDFPTYRIDHVFSTIDAKTHWMRNLYVGVRLTMLIGIPNKEHCILCDPWRH